MQRLYPSFQPDHYDLNLTLERAERRFSGSVTIRGTRPSTSDSIALHCKDLKIASATVNDHAAAFTLKDDELRIDASDVTDTALIVTVEFSGTITDPMHGLYPCYYEHNGVKKELLATQFESHHAREVFPCIDEPEAKATFDLTLVTEDGVTVLGNMPVKESSPVSNRSSVGKQPKTEDRRLKTTFQTTPRMSTYLLAFVVGELQSLEATTSSGVLVRTFATPAQPVENLRFALEHSVRTIDFFDDYFGVAYPLPKCDHIALPDFSSGAMENWGLITYRETALLMDSEQSSVSQQQYVASVVTHELSHQWFGNLVTMKWWDDLWLNESFASLMEYVGVDSLYPEWDVWLDFGPSERVPALQRDILPGVQAVHTDVTHPDEISTLFDPAIVYAKGSAVLHMLRAHIGEAAFRAGLLDYFETFKYQNTEGHDLWASFAKASGSNVTDFMDAWLNKPGYPLVRIDQQGTKVSLEQQRLYMSPKADTSSLWPIPLFTDQDSDALRLLDARDAQLDMTRDAFIMLNKGSYGLFASRYVQAKHREWLADKLDGNELAPADRLTLLHDSLLLARTGEQNLSESLMLALRCSRESRDAVWDIIALIIGESRRFIEGDDALERSLKNKVAALVANQLDTLGYKTHASDSIETMKLRASLYGLAVWAEYKPALDHALAEFDKFDSPDDLDPELRSIIYAAGGRWNKEAGYAKLFALYKQTVSAEEKQQLVGGLTASPEPAIIERLLGHIKDPEIVKPQDVFLWFAVMMRKYSAREQAWQWLETEWPWIEASFSSDKSFDYFPRIASSALFGETWLARYRTFFEPKKNIPALTRVITIGVDEIATRTAWYERDYPGLKKYLK